MTMEETETRPTGYDPDVKFYASRYRQGGRTVFSLDLSLAQLAALIPAPNPDVVIPDTNRRVVPSHAADFAAYIRSNPDWVSPSIELRGPRMFDFRVVESIENAEFGVVSFPRLEISELRILDGQHRILGIHMAIQAIANELEAERDALAQANREQDGNMIAFVQARIESLHAQRRRLDTERISIQVYVEESQVAFRQMFYDMADKALGIKASVRVRFDGRSVLNRTVNEVLSHPLLAGNVDMEADRIAGSNPHLLSAKHVADIVRTIAVGIDGRMGRRAEDELDEVSLGKRVSVFLDALVYSFPQLTRVAEGEITPRELRSQSQLASPVTLRVLAGVYREMVADEHSEKIGEFFVALNPYLSAPATSEWSKRVGGDLFTEGALAPKSRRQEVKAYQKTLLRWALHRPKWLSE